jgi:hypothetical protein
MITSNGYPTYCAGGKCIYPSRNAIQSANIIGDDEYDHNDDAVYGSKTSKYERFRDLGIPMFVLRIKPSSDSSQYDAEFNNQDNASVISEEMFDNLYRMVSQMSRNKDTRRNKKACRTVAPKQTRRQHKSITE